VLLFFVAQQPPVGQDLLILGLHDNCRTQHTQ